MLHNILGAFLIVSLYFINVTMETSSCLMPSYLLLPCTINTFCIPSLSNCCSECNPVYKPCVVAVYFSYCVHVAWFIRIFLQYFLYKVNRAYLDCFELSIRNTPCVIHCCVGDNISNIFVSRVFPKSFKCNLFQRYPIAFNLTKSINQSTNHYLCHLDLQLSLTVLCII